MTQPQAHPATVVSAGQVPEKIVTKHLQPSELSSTLPLGLVIETVKRGTTCLFALSFPSVPQKHAERSEAPGGDRKGFPLCHPPTLSQ